MEKIPELREEAIIIITIAAAIQLYEYSE